MSLTSKEKEKIKSEIINTLSGINDIEKIVLFGSFVKSDKPNDIDIGIYSRSEDNYLTLALTYRKLLRGISKIIPLDIIPLKNNKGVSFFDNELYSGEVIYERRN